MVVKNSNNILFQHLIHTFFLFFFVFDLHSIICAEFPVCQFSTPIFFCSATFLVCYFFYFICGTFARILAYTTSTLHFLPFFLIFLSFKSKASIFIYVPLDNGIDVTILWMCVCADDRIYGEMIQHSCHDKRKFMRYQDKEKIKKKKHIMHRHTKKKDSIFIWITKWLNCWLFFWQFNFEPTYVKRREAVARNGLKTNEWYNLIWYNLETRRHIV